MKEKVVFSMHLVIKFALVSLVLTAYSLPLPQSQGSAFATHS